MPRHMSERKLREYDELKRFFEVWEIDLFPNSFFASDHPHHPVNALAQIEQRFGRSRALSGLKQAINHSLEGVEDFGPEQLLQIDEALRGAGAPTLSQLVTRQSKVFKAVLRRGKIRNDTEFYMVSAALSDTSANRSEAEIATLGAMIATYEAKA